MDDRQDVRLLKGRLNGAQRNRLRKLLDMMYKPSELAKEVGFNVHQVYNVYIPAGCPHERDDRRYLWINGKAFREWTEKTYKKRVIGKNQAYCRTCDLAVDLINPTKHETKDTKYLQAKCPNCGRVITRFVENSRRGR